MAPKLKRERVDSLIDHLWQHGYLTLSRRFGKYLPAPPSIEGYEIDTISKYKKKIAVGITISEEDLNDPKFLTKIETLATARVNHPNCRVTLFVGVPYRFVVKATMYISSLSQDLQHNIKIVALPEK